MKMLLVAIMAVSAAALAKEEPKAISRIAEAHQVFHEIMEVGEQSVPRDLLDKAHCVAIVPGLKKGALIVGAKYGKGVLMCRKPGGGWTGPGAIRIEGGSFGLQIGGGEVDVILLVMNESGAQKLVKSEFTLGGTAGVMAGPVGRTVQAETDAYMRAQVLGYSRSRGVFAGAALEGATLREDTDDNAAIYGKGYSNEEILFGGKVPIPNVAKPLVYTLNRYSKWEK